MTSAVLPGDHRVSLFSLDGGVTFGPDIKVADREIHEAHALGAALCGAAAGQAHDQRHMQRHVVDAVVVKPALVICQRFTVVRIVRPYSVKFREVNPDRLRKASSME